MTGFGPFPGCAANPTEVVARALDGQSVGGWRIVADVLPVSWDRGPAQVARRVAEFQPDGIVHLGVAQESDCLAVEALAYNEMEGNRADVDGAAHRAAAIDPLRGPDPLRTGLDVARLVRDLCEAGFPAASSEDPGRYLCNRVYYGTLAAAPVGGHALFVHVPRPGTPSPDGSDWTASRLLEATHHVIQWFASLDPAAPERPGAQADPT